MPLTRHKLVNHRTLGAAVELGRRQIDSGEVVDVVFSGEPKVRTFLADPEFWLSTNGAKPPELTPAVRKAISKWKAAEKAKLRKREPYRAAAAEPVQFLDEVETEAEPDESPDGAEEGIGAEVGADGDESKVFFPDDDSETGERGRSDEHVD